MEIGGGGGANDVKRYSTILGFRHQQVIINNEASDIKLILFWCPTGMPIIGPVAVYSYVIDIVSIDHEATFIIYAYDTSLLFEGTDVMNLQQQATVSLSSLYKWSHSNSLLITVEKAKAGLFGPRDKTVHETSLLLRIGSPDIQMVSIIKTLGVQFNQ